MAPRKDKATVGTSTPVTIGLALAIAAAVAGFGVQAGTFSNRLDDISNRITSIEGREQQNSKSNIDLVTKLTRIEVLLEGATAAIARLEREKNR
jgi:outer membrane lipoprotein-sorting protein